MDKEKKDPKKPDNKQDPHETTKVDEKEVNDELRQTFPASDPPSATQPGHEEEEKE